MSRLPSRSTIADGLYSLTLVFYAIWGFLLISFISTSIGVSDLWIPAMATVFGSFGVYYNRQLQRRQQIRNGIKTELKQMDSLDDLPNRLNSLDKPPTKEKIPKDTVPAADSFPTMFYEQSIANLSILDQDLAEDIVEFYSTLLRHKATIRAIHTEQEGDDMPMSAHKDLCEDAEYLKEDKDKLINRLS